MPGAQVREDCQGSRSEDRMEHLLCANLEDDTKGQEEGCPPSGSGQLRQGELWVKVTESAVIWGAGAAPAVSLSHHCSSLRTCFSDTCWQTHSLPRPAGLPVKFFRFGQEASLHPIEAPTAALAWRRKGSLVP